MNKEEVNNMKAELVSQYNSIQQSLDHYPEIERAICGKDFKRLCAKKDEIERKIKELNKMMEDFL